MKSTSYTEKSHPFFQIGKDGRVRPVVGTRRAANWASGYETTFPANAGPVTTTKMHPLSEEEERQWAVSVIISFIISFLATSAAGVRVNMYQSGPPQINTPVTHLAADSADELKRSFCMRQNVLCLKSGNITEVCGSFRRRITIC